MRFLWLPVDDAPSPKSLRSYVERNAIALLSNWNRLAIDPPSRRWLGRAGSEKIRGSGLWNDDYVDATDAPEFRGVMRRLVANL